MACKSNLVVKQIIDLYDQISKLESLKPSKNVDTLFGQLVSTCLPTDTNIDVTKMSEEVKDMRSNLIKLCGEAEGYLEQHFSTILGSLLQEDQNPLDHLNIFPYYNNYLKLGKLEFDLLSQHSSHVPTKIAFVGSGPMPLTSIVLAKFHLLNTTFHNFDIDSHANALASSLVSRDPDLSKRMIFHTTDVLNATEGLDQYDVVFLAALVGMDKEAKVKAIEHLEKHMAPGAVLMLRSAHALRAFLYPIVDSSDLKGFQLLTIYHPTDDVVNSVVIARKFGGSTTTRGQYHGTRGCMFMPCNCSTVHAIMNNCCKKNKMIEKFSAIE
ncbi:LOW QUALITY PROTEIN: nicotianamine synthase 1 [Brassica rapa]|uniref:LOW QUALITY PROTEIN: nicotianamine synthase 1 n=1 Tax=Brassica campestris TaxID=3711 RepID=UPI00142D34E3|nr:LOW QUALITY PROTEIN: nicotianamine synthase 1 [Brassica rapa]